MLLFLDVVSPIPEFFVIEDNKVVIRTNIISNKSDKLSDNIFQTYFKLNNDLKLTEKLKKIAITIGPGSYTSLRVGASFISALKISRQLPFCAISIEDILNFKLEKNKNENLGFFIVSSNNQQFFCSLNKNKKIEYLKIDEEKEYLFNQIDALYYNFRELKTNDKNLKQYKFFIIEEFLNNFSKLIFTKKGIIKPIYISNNKILN